MTVGFRPTCPRCRELCEPEAVRCVCGCRTGIKPDIRCVVCERKIVRQTTNGRPPKYCGDECRERVAAHREWVAVQERRRVKRQTIQRLRVEVSRQKARAEMWKQRAAA